jgi:hypothetical protein
MFTKNGEKFYSPIKTSQNEMSENKVFERRKYENIGT